MAADLRRLVALVALAASAGAAEARRRRLVESCYEFKMYDLYTDGWDGTRYEFLTLDNVTVANGTMVVGPEYQTDDICFAEDGCFLLNISGGFYHEEHKWVFGTTDFVAAEPFEAWEGTPYLQEFRVSAGSEIAMTCETVAPTVSLAPTVSPEPTAAPTVSPAPTAFATAVDSFAGLDAAMSSPASSTNVEITGDFVFTAPVTVAADTERVVFAEGALTNGRRLAEVGAFVLDGGLATTLFVVDGWLTVQGPLELVNGYTSTFGGAVVVAGYNATATFIDVHASGSYADLYGGFAHVSGGGKLKLVNCTLEWNGAEQLGGAIYNDVYSTTVLLGGFIRSSYSQDCGALYNNVGAVMRLLQGTVLEGNEAFSASYTTQGGAVCNGFLGELLMVDAVFQNNTATFGGAVHNDVLATLTVIRGVFEHNAARDGGALYDEANGTSFAATRFSNNTAANNGGAAYSAAGSLLFENCTAYANKAAVAGGVVYREVAAAAATGLLELRGGRYEANRAATGAVAHVVESVFKARGGTFSRNVAEKTGGCFYVAAQDAWVEAATLERNEAAQGGAIALDYGAVDAGDASGAVELFVWDVRVVGNRALARGGGVYCLGTPCNVVGWNLVLEANEAIEGSAFFSATSFATVNIEGWKVRRNRATEGTIFITLGSTLVMSDVYSTANVAGLGAFASLGALSTANVTNCTSDRDVATGSSVLVAKEDSTCTLSDVCILDARVGEGAAFHANFARTVVIERSMFRGCASGGASGAALLVAFGTGQSAHVTETTFADNVAVECGAAAATGGGEVTFEGVSFLNNLATDSAGALCLKLAANATVRASTFQGNRAKSGHGGAVAVESDATLEAVGSTFRFNAAPEGGCMSLEADARIRVRACSFENNTATAGRGGAVAVSSSTQQQLFASGGFESLGGNVFAGNEASLGGGVVATRAGARCVFQASDAASHNVAGGGGGVAHFEPRTTAAPVQNGLALKDNRALYGANWGSDAVRIAATHEGSSSSFSFEQSGFPFEGSVVVSAYDYYGELVRDFADEVALAALANSTAQQGRASFFFEDGAATWDPGILTLTDAPDRTVTLRASLEVHTDLAPADLDVELRACVAGEETEPSKCHTCPPGQYAFRAGGPCEACMKHASCEGDHTVRARKGYWRMAWNADEARLCKYDDSCGNAGVDLWGNTSVFDAANETDHLHPDAQCSHHHAGPLCATCERGFVLQLVSGKCAECDSGARVSAMTIVLACALSVLLVLLLYLLAKSLFSAAIAVLGESIAYFARFVRTCQSRSKILIAFYQIISSFTLNFPTVRFPDLFKSLSTRVAFFNFDLAGLVSVLYCQDRFDYLDRLVFATVSPIVVSLALFLGYGITVRCLYSGPKHAKVQKQLYCLTWLAFLVMTYCVLTQVSSVAIRSLQCDRDFEASKDSPYHNDAYLFADYSVSCKSRRYQALVPYAALMVCVYPVGIPLMYLLLLYRKKDSFAPSNVDDLAKKIVATKDDVSRRFKEGKAEYSEALEACRAQERDRRDLAAATAGTKKVKQKLEAATAKERWLRVKYVATLIRYKKLVRDLELEASICKQAIEYLSQRDAYERHLNEVNAIHLANDRAAAEDAEEAEDAEASWSSADEKEQQESGRRRRRQEEGPSTTTTQGLRSAVAGKISLDYFELHESTLATPLADAAALEVLGAELVGAYREFNDDSVHLEFLYDEYEPRCWYFEYLECTRRLVLTCVLPIPIFPTESLVHVFLATMVSFLFALFYANLRPFLHDSMDTFANVMQCILFVNLIFTLVLAADGHIDDRDAQSRIQQLFPGALLFLNAVVAPFSGIISMVLEEFAEDIADAYSAISMNFIKIASLYSRYGPGNKTHKRDTYLEAEANMYDEKANNNNNNNNSGADDDDDDKAHDPATETPLHRKASNLTPSAKVAPSPQDEGGGAPVPAHMTVDLFDGDDDP